MSLQSPHASPNVAAVAFANALAAYWARELGEQFLGAYLIGSLAHGGYSRRYSDIDVAVTTKAGLTSNAIDDMRVAANALAPELAKSVSLFWTDRHFAAGRFPLLDRLDYLDHAVLLAERELVRPDRPTIAEVRSYLCGPPFHNWRDNARHFAGCDALDPKDYKPYLRALLYPARFVYSWTRGSVTSNDEAVEFLSECAPPGLDIDLIARALHCRQANTDPVVLFSARKHLLTQVEACARLIVA